MWSDKSQQSWRLNCNPMHAQSPVVCACIVRALECDWLECRKTFIMDLWQVLGMCSQSSVVSSPLGLWLSSMTGWATILSKINSAVVSYSQRNNNVIIFYCILVLTVFLLKSLVRIRNFSKTYLTDLKLLNGGMFNWIHYYSGVAVSGPTMGSK